MAEIQVDSKRLRDAAEKLTGLVGQYKGKLEALTTAEQGMVAKWEGDAKNTYNNAFMNDKAQWEKFTPLVETYIQALLSAAAEYEKREAQNISIAGGSTK